MFRSLLIFAAGIYVGMLLKDRMTGAGAGAGSVVPAEKVPPGFKLTGRKAETHNNRPPGYQGEVVGSGTTVWAEVVSDKGEQGWVEAKA